MLCLLSPFFLLCNVSASQPKVEESAAAPTEAAAAPAEAAATTEVPVE